MGAQRRAARKRREAGGVETHRPTELSSLSDEVLLAEVKLGSEPHFDTLYRRYFGRIYGFLQLRVRNRADAEELTQEVFTAVFRSAGGFGERSSALSWIYGVARNTLLNHMRRQQLDRERFEQLSPEMLAPAPPDWSYTPEEQYRFDRLGEEVLRRIATLAPWQLDAFHYRHVEDLPIEEISRRTTRSADAVRSGLYRAKRLLLDAVGLGEMER